MVPGRSCLCRTRRPRPTRARSLEGQLAASRSNRELGKQAAAVATNKHERGRQAPAVSSSSPYESRLS
eukprot:44017-Hanusia_phi.AAC.1